MSFETAYGDRGDGVIVSIFGSVGVSPYADELAANNTRRTFANAQWMERKKYLTLHDGHFAWRDAAAVMPVAVTNPAALRVSGRPSLDTPLASLIKFKNPVLQREVRSLLRMRRFPDPVMALLGVAGVGALLLVVWMLLWVWIEPNARGTFWNTGARLALLASMTLMPLVGAAGIARERENGSWEGLRLSLLTPRQIVWGKALAPLLVLAGVIAALSPIWLPCINWLTLTAEPIGHGAPILNALAMLALIFCTAFNYTAWGLWISWRARSTAAATGWTMGTLFFFIVALPTVVQTALTILFTLFIGVDYQFGQNIGDPISLSLINRTLNPWDAAQGLLATPANYWESHYGGASPYSADPQLIVLATVLSTVVGALLLLDIERRMGKLPDAIEKAPSKPS